MGTYRKTRPAAQYRNVSHTLDYSDIIRRSRRIRAIKFTLIILAVSLVGTLVIWPLTSKHEDARVVTAPKLEDNSPSQAASMLNPQYQGVDKNNNPYTIIAKRAVQRSENIVDLEGIQTDVILDNDKWYSLSATQGMITVSLKQLDLTGKIKLTSYSNFTLDTTGATLDYGQGTVISDQPVVITGPAGKLKAKGFHVSGQNGDVIDFTGPVKLVFIPGPKKH